MIFDALARYRVPIERALAYSGGTHTFDDVAAGVFAGRFLLWPAGSSVVVTEWHTFPQKRVLHVFLAGGEMAEVLSIETRLTEFARQHGATALTLSGRPGWVRALRDRGWEQHLVQVKKEIVE